MPPIELIDSIENHLPLMSLARNCPNPRCNNSYRGYVSCGGPTGPQLGKIILKPNSGLNCHSFVNKSNENILLLPILATKKAQFLRLMNLYQSIVNNSFQFCFSP